VASSSRGRGDGVRRAASTQYPQKMQRCNRCYKPWRSARRRDALLGGILGGLDVDAVCRQAAAHRKHATHFSKPFSSRCKTCAPRKRASKTAPAGGPSRRGSSPPAWAEESPQGDAHPLGNAGQVARNRHEASIRRIPSPPRPRRHTLAAVVRRRVVTGLRSTCGFTSSWQSVESCLV